MTSHFKKTTAALLAGAGLIVSAGAGIAAVSVGDTLGTSEEAIRAQLTSQGDVIDEIEIENDELEVEAVLDGQEIEIVIDASTGAILEIELEDDEDDDKSEDGGN